MDEHLRHQRDTSLEQLEGLIRHGRHVRDTRSADAVRAWQRDCAAAINQLSGGSKAHWLARSYSDAFLVRRTNGGVVVEADQSEIVDRILGVLTEGAASLSSMDDVAAASSGAGPRPRRFDFVRSTALRPVLERALDDSRDALDRGEFGLALVLSCSVIDAMITDALDRVAPCSAGGGSQAADNPLHAPTFEQRIAQAEGAGLIHRGCARLPAVARTYQDLMDADGELRGDAPVTERDARLAGQVLRIVMRDLDPGR